MGGKKEMLDPRFMIEHDDDPEYSLVTRSSDGQMLFLANLLSKMKSGTTLGSRVAEVHNGSSLFTGDAGQGESNIRRWIIENDWLEAIVVLPLNMLFSEREKVFANPMATAAAIDRIVHHSVILEFDLPSYRTNEAHNRHIEQMSDRQK